MTLRAVKVVFNCEYARTKIHTRYVVAKIIKYDIYINFGSLDFRIDKSWPNGWSAAGSEVTSTNI